MTIRRLIACILLPTYLAACMSWQAQEASPQQVLAEEHLDKVLVKLADGSKLVLERPVVAGDSLIGLDDGTPVHIPLADVSSIAVKKHDSGKTGLAAIGGVLALGALVVGIGWYMLCVEDDVC